MADKQLKGKDAIKYILKFRRDLASKGVASESLEASKMKAAYEVLQDSNDILLLSAADEIKKDFDKEAKNENLEKAALLRSNIDTLE